jgi:arylsulfatase
MSLNTGRYHVRSGVNVVLFPGMIGQGISSDEVALAEVMSRAGYNTGMFGKWHLGFGDQYAPTKHGFDEAVWSEGNPVSWVQDTEDTEMAGHINVGAYLWGPKEMVAYHQDPGVMKAKKGGKPELVYELSIEKYNTYDTDVTDLAIDYINRKANDDKPFFLYVGGKGNHFLGANPDFMDSPAQTNTAAQLIESDYNLGRILAAVKKQGIEENTLVVWHSDNGPMYAWQPHGGYSNFDKGEKGQTWEGGVRVPAIAWWPGMIEPGQDPLDIFHVSDWYTTFASIAQGKKYIPTDIVVDGVDQTALLFFGEDNGQRDYNYYYNKGKLEAVRKDWTKIYLGGSKVFMPIVNLMHDPMERYLTEINYAAYEPVSLMRMVQEHNKQIAKYPHRVQPGSIREPDLPFDPAPTLKYEAKKQASW